MIKFEKKEDYVPFVVRVRAKDRNRLEKEATALKELINQKRPKDTKKITKGDICTEALEIGLAALKKKYG